MKHQPDDVWVTNNSLCTSGTMHPFVGKKGGDHEGVCNKIIY